MKPRSGGQITAVGEADRRNPRSWREPTSTNTAERWPDHSRGWSRQAKPTVLAGTTPIEPRSGGGRMNDFRYLVTATRFAQMDGILRGLHPRLCSGHAYGVQ